MTSDPAKAARHMLQATRSAVEALEGTWNEELVRSWTEHVTRSKGRLVLSGMGKSGLVAQKISATLASTGCPSFYEEVVRLLPSLIRLGVKIGAITARPDSRLGQAADWCFTYAMPEGEGCPLNFAPMASTTLQLVWGDLLAAYHMVQSGFTLEHFAQFHPAGNLGARLLKVGDLMHTEFPKVAPATSLVEVLSAMTLGKLGMTTVVEGGRLAGVISEGDIRRALLGAQKMRSNPLDLAAINIMTPNPIAVGPATLAVETAKIMEARKITFVIVKEGDAARGVVHIHDLFAAKVI